MSIKNLPMVRTLLSLKGNPRSCVYTEPMWGIPYSLYSPYAAMFMAALGLMDKQIGIITSAGIAVQAISSLLSGVLTDKLGRRKTTLIFDIFAWSIPCLLWAFAQNFAWFLAAALLNGIWRVTSNSWTCLLVEDIDEDTNIMHIFAWVNIAGQITVFIAPLAGLLIGHFTLVPTVRAFYLFAFAAMSAKFIVLWFTSRETRQGKKRLEHVKGVPFMKLLIDSWNVFRAMLRAPRTMLTIGLMAVIAAVTSVNNAFWALRVTYGLGVPETLVPIFPFLRSALMLTFYFFITPRVSHLRARIPYAAAFGAYIVSMLTMLLAPDGAGMFIPIVSALLESAALSIISPVNDSMQVINVDADERARIVGIIQSATMLLAFPFGLIAGYMSEIQGALPFLLNIILLLVGLLLSMRVTRLITRENGIERAHT